MKIEIKKALLEGHAPEQIITEAKHAGTVYEKGTALGRLNRPELAKIIKSTRQTRDTFRSANMEKFANANDNLARVKSQMSNPKEKLDPRGMVSKYNADAQQPRLYQAAKQ